MAWKGDPHAFHDDVDGEIDALTEKATPIDADLVIINDSADGNSVKSAQLGNLPGGGGSSDLDGLSDVTITSPANGERLVYDGSEWVNSPAVNEVRVVEIADAAPKTVYNTSPQAVYDPASDRTYIGFLGEDRDLYFTYYDHQAGDVATPVLADNRVISVDDIHAAPTICVDTEGHLHAVWGSHNSQHRHVKSDNPHDISSWSGQTLSTSGTYPHIVVDRSNGDLYVFDRTGSGHGSTFPAHEFGGVRKSTDGGSSWSAVTEFIDATGTPESATDVYIGEVREADDGRFHIAWLLSRGSSHDDTHTNVHHAIFDPSDGNLYTADGDNLGSIITFAEHSDCLVESIVNITYRIGVTLDGDRVLLSYGRRGTASDESTHVAVWDGSSWTVTDTGVNQDKNSTAFTATYPTKDGLRLMLAEADAAEDDLKLYGAPTEGTLWVELATVVEGSTGEGFDRVEVVPGGGESVGIAQEQPTGYTTNTNATSSDLLPLYLILDPAHAVYQNSDHDHDDTYSATSHDHDDTYYTESEVDDLFENPTSIWKPLLDDDGAIVTNEDGDPVMGYAPI